MKQTILFIATTFSGLSAGLFYAWTVSVVPGTRKVVDITYLETMQSINREILNPAFFLIYFGTLITLVICCFQQHDSGPVFWVVLGAMLTYLVGTFGVTAMGNVPLNNVLEALNLHDMTGSQLADFRQHYESQWNRWHFIRTAFSVITFLLILLSNYFTS